MCKKQKEVLNIKQKTQQIDRLNKGSIKGPGIHQENVARVGSGLHPRVPTRGNEIGRSATEPPSVTRVSGSRVAPRKAGRFAWCSAQMIGDLERSLSKPGGDVGPRYEREGTSTGVEGGRGCAQYIAYRANRQKYTGQEHRVARTKKARTGKTPGVWLQGTNQKEKKRYKRKTEKR